MAAINRGVVAAFRSGEPVQGMHRERLLLLTTTGRRSGRSVTHPMMFHTDGDAIFVIASNRGAPKHPDWYLNLVGQPRVTVERDTPAGRPERYTARARPTTGDERAAIWAAITAAHPFFVDHEQRAGGREIPVVALTRD